MSTSVVQTRSRPLRRAAVALACVGFAITLAGGLPGCPEPPRDGEPPGTAEPDPAPTPVDVLTGGMAAYVDAMVAEPGEWRGQRVPWPAVATRPASEVDRASWLWPVTVHGPREALDATTAARWVDALEGAYVWLHAEGWPLPPADGGRGGTDGFDLYVIDAPSGPPLPDLSDDGLDPDPTRRARLSGSRFDARLFNAGNDTAIVHAFVSSEVPRDRLDACAIQLVASAGLFSADPAEAESLREATAAWLAWNATGLLGCDEDALARQQAASHRALITTDPRDGEGAALFLAAMSSRHDGVETGFLRDVWQMARQRTRDRGDLQGEPDVLRMLGQASTLAHDPMDRVVESMAVARYFVGREGAARPDVPLIAALRDDARVPVFVTTSWERLPRTLRPAPDAAPLEPWGSAYARVDVRGAPADSVLRVWLDGEFGTEWSLVAVRLDASGAERGRTRAPPTRTARGYVPVELGGGEPGTSTAEVVIVVTNVPDDDDFRDQNPDSSHDATIAGRIHRTGLDADTPGPGPHGFRLIVDHGP